MTGGNLRCNNRHCNSRSGSIIYIHHDEEKATDDAKDDTDDADAQDAAISRSHRGAKPRTSDYESSDSPSSSDHCDDVADADDAANVENIFHGQDDQSVASFDELVSFWFGTEECDANWKKKCTSVQRQDFSTNPEDPEDSGNLWKDPNWKIKNPKKSWFLKYHEKPC